MKRLGGFLLKAFSRKAKLRKLRGQGSRPAPTRPRRRVRARPALVPVLRSRSSHAPAPAPAPEPSKWISSAALIRPDDRLKASMEGFLLDQRSIHTRRAYGRDLKRFLQFLHGKNAEKGAIPVDRTLLIGYKEYLLSEGLEHTTVDRHLATLRSFFRWLVDDGHIPSNPAEAVRFLNPKRLSRTIGFTDEEVRKVLAAPDIHTRTGAQHYAILMLLFHCGLRRSELCQLRTTNIQQERGHWVLRLTGKGNAERILVLITPAWNALRHYLKVHRKELSRDEFLFSPLRNNRTGLRDKPLDPSAIFYLVTRYARLGGVANRVSPHSCRATAISNARDHNVPDRAIQEFAGWSTTNMITRYDKRRSAVDQSAAHAINYDALDRAGLT